MLFKYQSVDKGRHETLKNNTNFRTGTLSSTEIVRSLFLGKMKQVGDYQSKSFQNGNSVRIKRRLWHLVLDNIKVRFRRPVNGYNLDEIWQN